MENKNNTAEIKLNFKKIRLILFDVVAKREILLPKREEKYLMEYTQHNQNVRSYLVILDLQHFQFNRKLSRLCNERNLLILF